MINLITNILTTNGGINGELTGVYEDSANLYSSSIDPIHNLIYKYSYDTGLTNIPLLVIMHGWNGDMNEFTSNEMHKFASYKYFVLAPGMRGRNDADGSRDASAIELYDIYDAIFNILNYFPHLIDSTKISIAGWSGGGGNVIGMCSKFPDLFNMAVANFPMSDYGYDLVESWRITNPGYNAGIVESVGVPPTETNEYLTRKANNAIQNYQGYLYLFHDTEDSIVDVLGSQNVDAKMILEGKTNYEYNQSTIGDPERWLHSPPYIGSDIEKAEVYWKDDGLTRISKTIPNSGILTIIGYLKTKRFIIWLGDGSSHDGISRNATLVYDVAVNSYTVTPIMEGTVTDMEVKIIQRDGKTATQTISNETEIIVS